MNDLRTPLRNVQSHAHDDTADQTSRRQGEDPSEEDVGQLFPIDTLKVVVDQGNADDGTSDALRRRNGQAVLCRDQDSDSSTKFHAVATSRGVLGDAVSKAAHDVVAESPKTCYGLEINRVHMTRYSQTIMEVTYVFLYSPTPRPIPPTALIQVGVGVLAIVIPERHVIYSVVKGPMALDTSLPPCAMDMILFQF